MGRKPSGQERLVTISVKVSTEVQKRLQDIAEVEDRSVSRVAFRLLRKALVDEPARGPARGDKR
jgi:predicted transcriptional regulator